MILAALAARQVAVDIAYLVAASLFILGLRGLASPRSARRGNLTAAVGMVIAIAASLVGEHPSAGVVELAVAAVVVGAVIGAVSARRVRMTAMPQMVAAFNGVGGGAASTVAIVSVLATRGGGATLASVASVLSVAIGAISFAGSAIAFAKLQELMTGRPITYTAQQVVNALLLLAVIGGMVAVAVGPTDRVALGVLVAAAVVLGVAFVLPIGGADMPVVISLLNAFTGLAVAATGFVVHSTVVIIGGTLVGASGTLLTKLMSDAMGRSLANVLFAAVGSAPKGAGGAEGIPEGATVRSGTADDIGTMLAYASKVVIVPGYGLAVAQAQHTVRDLVRALEGRGVEVSFGIHPVAGRMPGHMNVLLAEADIPYEQLHDLEQANDEFRTTDVVLVVGANDVVNPAARTQSSSPIYGMPILNVDEAKTVVFLKRSMRPGFAGVDNPLFYNPKTVMLFGDAKASLAALVAAVKAA
ncbi:NAD(P)(+) transhydrogenase (AB-specific) [Acidimicrobium ferrooxidans DSM 10331]|uniref:NAD(P) transhydrogenase subunit beta n=1 Tax=Acidimicrobium ferrooxidans (strain DSM 10331 / JCM 15462 / NBRC 103882 / ICP) TaxID=525909 RepID=C7M1Y4_ACIFD|nr:NAD(P)(+) transhydrogenase (Re/Si-specific) subunit beta [Acidimicrobium ferrooxidans]ACU54881.1 NAD(P)(+) transhydrogenase (AB-specific) [Acidimicrobium ferrooxidans DSM 10331]